MYRTNPLSNITESQPKMTLRDNGAGQMMIQESPIKKNRLPSHRATTIAAQAHLVASLDEKHRSRYALLPELFQSGQQGLFSTLDDQIQHTIPSNKRHYLQNQKMGLAQTSRQSFPFEQGERNYQSTQIDSNFDDTERMHLKQVMDLQDGESVVSSEEQTVGITDPKTSSKYSGLIKHAGAVGQASNAHQSQKKHNLKATIPEFKGLRKVSTIDSPAQPPANRTGRINIYEIGISSAQQERQGIAVDLTTVSSTECRAGLPQAAPNPDS